MFDKDIDPSHGMLLANGVEKAKLCIDECLYVHFGIDCQTFSRASLDAFRSNDFVLGHSYGHSTWNLKRSELAQKANHMADIVGLLIEYCERRGIMCTVGDPRTSHSL